MSQRKRSRFALAPVRPIHLVRIHTIKHAGSSSSGTSPRLGHTRPRRNRSPLGGRDPRMLCYCPPCADSHGRPLLSQRGRPNPSAGISRLLPVAGPRAGGPVQGSSAAALDMRQMCHLHDVCHLCARRLRRGNPTMFHEIESAQGSLCRR